MPQHRFVVEFDVTSRQSAVQTRDTLQQLLDCAVELLEHEPDRTLDIDRVYVCRSADHFLMREARDTRDAIPVAPVAPVAPASPARPSR